MANMKIFFWIKSSGISERKSIEINFASELQMERSIERTAIDCWFNTVLLIPFVGMYVQHLHMCSNVCIYETKVHFINTTMEEGASYRLL